MHEFGKVVWRNTTALFFYGIYIKSKQDFFLFTHCYFWLDEIFLDLLSMKKYKKQVRGENDLFIVIVISIVIYKLIKYFLIPFIQSVLQRRNQQSQSQKLSTIWEKIQSWVLALCLYPPFPLFFFFFFCFGIGNYNGLIEPYKHFFLLLNKFTRKTSMPDSAVWIARATFSETTQVKRYRTPIVTSQRAATNGTCSTRNDEGL